MYAIDLAQISLDEFLEIMLSIELLPGRKFLLNNLSGTLVRFKQKGIFHLAALQQLLRDKNHYPALAKSLEVSQDFIVVLNREVNSYISKPVPLATLGVFSLAILERLEQNGIKSTKDLYENALSIKNRQDLMVRYEISEQQITTALELSDLLRINGVGPVFAKILLEIGITNTSAFLTTDTSELLEKYTAVNDGSRKYKSKLGTKDIEYCKRFCTKLDAEIEW